MFVVSGKLKKKFFDLMEHYYRLFIFPLIFLAISAWVFVLSLYFFPDSVVYFGWIFLVSALIIAYFYTPNFSQKNETK